MANSSFSLNPQVRLARAEDDLEVGELLVRSYVQTYAREMPEVRVTDDRKRELRDVAQIRADSELYVLEADLSGKHAVLGCLALYAPGARASRSWRADASEVRYNVIDPAVQGRGVGTLLMEAALRRAEVRGDRAMTLHIRRGAHGLAKYYSRLGFLRAPAGDKDQLPVIFLGGYEREF